MGCNCEGYRKGLLETSSRPSLGSPSSSGSPSQISLAQSLSSGCFHGIFLPIYTHAFSPSLPPAETSNPHTAEHLKSQRLPQRRVSPPSSDSPGQTSSTKVLSSGCFHGEFPPIYTHAFSLFFPPAATSDSHPAEHLEPPQRLPPDLPLVLPPPLARQVRHPQPRHRVQGSFIIAATTHNPCSAGKSLYYRMLEVVVTDLNWILVCFGSRTNPHWTTPTKMTPHKDNSTLGLLPTRTIPHRDNSPPGQSSTGTTPHQDDSPLGQLPTRTIPHQDNSPPGQFPTRMTPH